MIGMIKHIVMWKFKENEKENMRIFLEKLNGLYGVIPEIIGMQTGININKDGEFDAVLISEFKSAEDLEKYKSDPRHKAVSQLCKSIRVKREAIDFEF